jgi:hypothetical protein
VPADDSLVWVLYRSIISWRRRNFEFANTELFICKILRTLPANCCQDAETCRLSLFLIPVKFCWTISLEHNKYIPILADATYGNHSLVLLDSKTEKMTLIGFYFGFMFINLK